MYILVSIILIILILLGLGSLYSTFKTKIAFFINGFDAGFSLADLVLLWNVAQICDLDQPLSLFWSLNSLNKCMAQISSMAENTEDENHEKNQRLLSKLFDYRTKVQNDSDDKKGLTSTKTLERGQKIRVLLPGKGVFSSEITGNGQQLVISVPRQKDLIPITAEEWVGKVVSIYLWRKGDARYVFDTSVTQSGLYIGKPSLFLNHSVNLVRTQKRKAVRAKCEIYGKLYILTKPLDNYFAIETKNGYKCLIEDISESGAQIRIGGKGAENVQIQLQFNIQNMLIVMHGIIRTVDYSEVEKQSLLHFECIHIEQGMRNEVLRYVYKLLPENEKEVLEALSQTDDDVDEAERNIMEVAAANDEAKETLSSVEEHNNLSDEMPEFSNFTSNENI